MKSHLLFFLPTVLFLFHSCRTADKAPSEQDIQAIQLNKGDVIWCGPPDANFGSVDFLMSASPETRKLFDQAIAILHSFEYIEAEKGFANVIKKDPSCAMAYWGVAMSNFHPLWEPPKPDELAKGAKAISIARSLNIKSPRESDYIEAMGVFYDNYTTVDHKTRIRNYERAMSGIYDKYTGDNEAAIFYALALNSTADPTDKSYRQQKKAGAILEKLYKEQPQHPGIVHYIIHNYDNPDLAELALPAARKYASLAPASAHAQHMPSHIFVRLGLWDEAIHSNIESINSAKCYAEKAALTGNFDEELHGLDYLMYAYLQKGDNSRALQQLNYIQQDIKSVSAQNLKVAYAYAAIPARYMLENRRWSEAARLTLFPADMPWEKFPWQKGIVAHARLMGKVNTGDIKGAREELTQLEFLHSQLLQQKDIYKAKQLEVQLQSGLAWIEFKSGNREKAIEWMQKAADLEDGTEKHPVTPGEVLPARELLGDMLMQMNKPWEALVAYKADLKRHANRFNALFGAATAAEKSGNNNLAIQYYNKLIEIAAPDSNRPELQVARERVAVLGTENKVAFK